MAAMKVGSMIDTCHATTLYLIEGREDVVGELDLGNGRVALVCAQSGM